MPYSLPDMARQLLYIGDVIKGPWPQRMLEGGPVYRGGANPPAGSLGERLSQYTGPGMEGEAQQRPTWQQQYGTPQPGQPSIDTPSMRAAMEAGDAKSSELERFGQGMGLRPGQTQQIYNGLVFDAEKTGKPNPSVNDVKYYLTLLGQRGQLPKGGS